jgi:hypothetical protein
MRSVATRAASTLASLGIASKLVSSPSAALAEVDAQPSAGRSVALVNCQDDAQVIYRSQVYNGLADRYLGYVDLQYSPSCRAVRAVTRSMNPCRGDGHGCHYAQVYDGADGSLVTNAFSPLGATKVATAWVDDAGQCKYAYGEISDPITGAWWPGGTFCY